MKFRFYFFLLLFFINQTIFSQCFDCGFNIGGFIEDYINSVVKVSDGIVLNGTTSDGPGKALRKYDFNCNLVWTTDLPFDGMPGTSASLGNIIVGDNDNLYAYLVNNQANASVGGVEIPDGVSVVKIDPNGNILWASKIHDFYYQRPKIYYHSNSIYVVGEFEYDMMINDQVQLNLDGDPQQYYLAKYDDSGALVTARQYGSEVRDHFFDGSMDNQGFLYFTGRRNISSITYTHLMKFDSDLNLVWEREMSSNDENRPFYPMRLHYNDKNDKFYLWGKYYIDANFYGNSISVNNNCEPGESVGGLLLELSPSNGDLENHIVIDDCGFLSSVGNGIGNVEQNNFMAHDDDNLYVLSSFRGELTLGGQTVVTDQIATADAYNVDLLLYKVQLDSFSPEIILKSEGLSHDPVVVHYDLPGPIIYHENSIYLTSSFTSSPIIMNGQSIPNNSGNNARDILFYKYKLENNTYSLDVQNTCLNNQTLFEIQGVFDTVNWDFDDPTTGSNNNSTLNNPTHVFSQSGTYNVSATIMCGTDSQTIYREVIITDIPTINTINDLLSCEDIINTGYSSSFDTSNVENEITGGLNNISIEYYDANNIQLPSPLPNPMTNTTPINQQITARVFFTNNPQCFSETTFSLVVQSLPELPPLQDMNSCDQGNGLATFDLTSIQSQINTTGNLEFYDSNYTLINNSVYTNYQNLTANADVIYVRLIDQVTDCYSETIVNLFVDPLPIANVIADLIGCDDNNDGFSESFDTSQIESQVLGGQSGMLVTYYDQNNNSLPSPLPNPYTNTTPFNETIRVRVTNLNTQCFSESSISLITSTQPAINQPQNAYACDQGNGFAIFNINNLEEQIIGNQTGLNIIYSDSQGNTLPSPFPISFQNTEVYDQTIYVRVENSVNPSCFSETSFHLLVNQLPLIELEEEYTICGLQESLTLNANSSMDSYEWVYEDGSNISQTNIAILTLAGSYTLNFSKNENGVECSNSITFELIRSDLPEITSVDIVDLSNNNSITINVTGDGQFEYSLDGSFFQDSNVFENLAGGIYTAFVRDKNNCGQDQKEVVVIDYPKFFTPNDDGVNDFWNVPGLQMFPNSYISIYNRYGKKIKVIKPNEIGWNGTYQGAKMPSNDYWFSADLGNGKAFNGHFALMR